VKARANEKGRWVRLCLSALSHWFSWECSDFPLGVIAERVCPSGELHLQSAAHARQ
jgi:hypothetical protein